MDYLWIISLWVLDLMEGSLLDSHSGLYFLVNQNVLKKRFNILWLLPTEEAWEKLYQLLVQLLHILLRGFWIYLIISIYPPVSTLAKFQSSQLNLLPKAQVIFFTSHYLFILIYPRSSFSRYYQNNNFRIYLFFYSYGIYFGFMEIRYVVWFRKY